MSMPLHSSPAPAVEEDLDHLPEHLVGEILGGELIVHPRPDPPHTEAASDLVGFLHAPFRRGIGGPGGWVILVEPKVRLGADLLVPDLAGWRQERFVSPPKGPYTVAPDWICEVLSPSTERDDRVRKLPIYARERVAHAWLLDPELRTLEVLRLHEGSWLIAAVYEGSDKVRAEPFAAIEMDLGLIWGPGDGGDEAESPSPTGS